MADSEKIIRWIIYIEDDKHVPGKIVDLGDGAGLTRLGLTQKWHHVDVPAEFFTVMPFTDAVKIAKSVYTNQQWAAIHGDEIDSDIVAAPLMSFAVNDTPLVASKTLQRVLGVVEDGHIGPKTLAELNSKDPEIVAKMFRAEWIDFYERLVKIAPLKQKFLEGWKNRANYPFPGVVPNIYNE